MPQETITSDLYVDKGYWRLDQRVDAILDAPTSSQYASLKKLLGLIRQLDTDTTTLGTSQKIFEENQKIVDHYRAIQAHPIINLIPKILAEFTDEDEQAEEISGDLEHNYGLATASFVETYDQIRGYFRELGLDWWLRDMRLDDPWTSKRYSTIFLSAMAHIVERCAKREL